MARGGKQGGKGSIFVTIVFRHINLLQFLLCHEVYV